MAFELKNNHSKGLGTMDPTEMFLLETPPSNTYPRYLRVWDSLREAFGHTRNNDVSFRSFRIVEPP
jgi:hypothetical protein